ncbi:N4-gp56 family major capsid protein [Piscinibacter gummiphilus]|uniref:N4-gp56 family major capsid protein n=1 Tax=Piscinibacter gummiphilus TaxID=946333 RepID=A0ABZ0CNA5_9BURK|nr:N4-gp56 family major capsid protein [Piscinibacter gummiphilus]WOB06472.1 N4-gp56 family major capsid protein [Piscinibacter gummiphilus]
MTTYGDISPRTAAYAEKELLKRGLPFLVLEKFGQAKALPEHNSKVVKFRRYSALPTTPVALSEGVTPVGQTLSAVDITATLSQYGDKTTITDVVLDTHEDPVLNEAIALLGEQAAQMIEKMRFGVLKAGTNVLYANGANRAAVNTAITITLQRRAVRALKRQNARFITSIVRSTPSYGTENVAPGYVALIHPDCEADVRGLAGFVPAEKYGSITPWENELGKVEDVRYVSSTIFEPWANAGGTAGSMLSTGGAQADVYPVLFLARDAYGIVALKGMFAVTPMVVNPKPSDSDPLAQRGHVSWKAMQTAVILNDAFMVRGEVAATA